MKSQLTLLALIIAELTFAQGDLKSTSSFNIVGSVKSPVRIQLADLSKWPVQEIGDVVITNHLGEKKSEAKGLKGVLLKDVLQSVEINAESPKVLSEFYFKCIASDGYIVVYSWNELFNSPTGKSAYIVTEKDGKKLADMRDAILMISTSDTATGRRYVKALATIEVRRAQ